VVLSNFSPNEGFEMASIRFRNNKWQARVVRKGITPISRTFLTKLDAEKWARKIETEIDRNSYINTSLAEKSTFKEIIQRYIKEVTPTMKSVSIDTIKLNAICRKSITNLSMFALTPMVIAEYRDLRLKEVTSGTVLRVDFPEYRRPFLDSESNLQYLTEVET